jgi:hypothetical protein
MERWAFDLGGLLHGRGRAIEEFKARMLTRSIAPSGA